MNAPLPDAIDNRKSKIENPKIALIDYGMGNLASVQKALQRVGHDATITDDPASLPHFDKLILPGVGNFADGMIQLRQRNLIAPLQAFAKANKPMLGICLGMQLMFNSSTEDAPPPPEGPIPGLGLIPGDVVRFNEDQGPGQPRLKVPHMGWNALSFTFDCPLFDGLLPGEDVYFVHGYYCRPRNPRHTAATCEYGQTFCAAAHAGHLWATQFHPEKSQHAGLRILRNFAEAA